MFKCLDAQNSSDCFRFWSKQISSKSFRFQILGLSDLVFARQRAKGWLQVKRWYWCRARLRLKKVDCVVVGHKELQRIYFVLTENKGIVKMYRMQKIYPRGENGWKSLERGVVGPFCRLPLPQGSPVDHWAEERHCPCSVASSPRE